MFCPGGSNCPCVGWSHVGAIAAIAASRTPGASLLESRTRGAMDGLVKTWRNQRRPAVDSACCPPQKPIQAIHGKVPWTQGELQETSRFPSGTCQSTGSMIEELFLISCFVPRGRSLFRDPLRSAPNEMRSLSQATMIHDDTLYIDVYRVFPK